MKEKEIIHTLTELFNSKINYNGKFDSLFFIDEYKGKIRINFLNKQHFNFVINHLFNDISQIINDENIEFGYLNLKTDPISLKNQDSNVSLSEEKNQKQDHEEKVELPTLKNKILNQIETFIKNDYFRLVKEQKEIRKAKQNYLDSLEYSHNYGQINYITYLYEYIESLKDYENKKTNIWGGIF